MFSRIAVVLTIIVGLAESFRCLPSRPCLGSKNSHRMKMVSSTTEADNRAVAFENPAKSENAKFDWNKQVSRLQKTGILVLVLFVLELIPMSRSIQTWHYMIPSFPSTTHVRDL